MSGRVGRFFISFGVTVAFAILMSMLVSFTLTPDALLAVPEALEEGDEEQKHGKSHHSGGVYGWIAERPYLLDPPLVDAAPLGHRAGDRPRRREPLPAAFGGG